MKADVSPAITISDEIKHNIPLDLLEFILYVLGEEKLNWDCHIWSCAEEGICDNKIRFGLCKTERETRELFLHEVAHAILNPLKSCQASDWHPDSYWHRNKWQVEFKRLEYLYLGSDYDICCCGDYRHQHRGGFGKCRMPDDASHGFNPCLKFRFCSAERG